MLEAELTNGGFKREPENHKRVLEKHQRNLFLPGINLGISATALLVIGERLTRGNDWLGSARLRQSE
jgi:hypothetical protein